MKRILGTALLIGFTAGLSLAQNKNIIVLGNKKATSKERKKKNDYPSMAIKVNALNFIAGNLPICFEKEFHNFSLLVGAGPTFHRYYDNSYWSSIFDEDDVIYSWGTQELSSVNNPFSFDVKRPRFQYKPSYYFVVNPKYYYNEEGMDGPYFALQYVMSQYSFSNPAFNQTTFTKPGRDRYTDILVQWGAQYGDNKMVFEWFTGLGIRFKDELRYASGTDFSGNFIEGTAQIKKSVLRYDLGFRVGFKF